MEELLKIEKLILFEKKYDEAIEAIENSQNRHHDSFQNLLANALFYKNDFKSAAKIYESLEKYYQTGYCLFLINQTDEAIEYLLRAPDSPAQNWSLFLAELFRANAYLVPTYLQVRAFLERDLNLFLKLDLVAHVQKITDISDYLFEINPETNKYIARAFLFNDYPDYAKEYLDRAFDFIYKDAELHYLLAKYHLALGFNDKAKEDLEESLRLSDSYIPAKLLLDKISDKNNDRI